MAWPLSSCTDGLFRRHGSERTKLQGACGSRDGHHPATAAQQGGDTEEISAGQRSLGKSFQASSAGQPEEAVFPKHRPSFSRSCEEQHIRAKRLLHLDNVASMAGALSSGKLYSPKPTARSACHPTSTQRASEAETSIAPARAFLRELDALDNDSPASSSLICIHKKWLLKNDGQFLDGQVIFVEYARPDQLPHDSSN